MQLSLHASADGPMIQAHVVCENVDGSSLVRRDSARKDQDLAGGIISEESQFGIEIQGLWVIQVNVS
jgi:hypothetical protein